MNKPRANEIDLLRFLAAIAVVLFHYAFRGYVGHASSMPYPWLAEVVKYGCYGVELFFMISGFVILMSASSGSVKHFAISRVVRLYPAFWVCCTLTFLVLVMFGRNQPSVALYLSNMTMLSGFGFMQKIVPGPHIDGSYWSLVVEMRFYALVALVLVLRQIRHTELFLCGWLATVVLFEWAGMEHLREILIVDYASFFIAGAMMYQIWSHGLSRLRVGVILGCWGLSLYESWIGLPKFEASTHTIMDRGIVLSLVTVFFVVMFLVAVKKTGWIGRQNWVKLGALTYPLYLIHQSIGYVVFNQLYPAWNPHLLLWGTLATMIVVAYLINVYVERPAANALKQLLNRWWNASHAFFTRTAAGQP
jgi:peptidoglycan/LPS O-acetylase OafA/YrhL